MSDLTSVFGGALSKDPAVAIPSPPAATTGRAGPEHRTQFVVELVGPRSVPAQAAAALLSAQWFQALGQPELFAMSAADRDWQPLTARTDGSYDSLVLAWDLLSDRGILTTQAAKHLFQTAESFASHIQRRAMPLPPPEDIDRYVAALKDIQENLDIGVEILLVPKAGGFAEKEIWIHLAKLGYDLKASGFFEITPVGSSHPLVTVTPTGGADGFRLSSVQSGVTHPAVLIGFSLPLSPNASYSLDAALKTASYLATNLNGVAFTDSDQMLDSRTERELKSNLDAAVVAMTNAGIQPGSRAAMNLFAG